MACLVFDFRERAESLKRIRLPAVNCSPALAVNGEEVLFHEPLEFCLGEFTAQSVFLDVTGHVHPFDAALLVVVVVQLLEDFDGLLVR
jgi:hypothetical protein